MAETPYSPPPVQNRSPKPPGILPRNAQAWVIGGIALLMVFVIAISGRNTPKERSAAPTSAATVVDPNDARIQEYRVRIEQQAQKLALEQARLAQTRQTLGALPGSGSEVRGRLDIDPGRGSAAPSPMGYTPSAGPEQEQKRWIALDREKREYESRYASNLALSHRSAAAAPPVSRTVDDIRSGAETEQPVKNPVSPNIDAELRQADGKTYHLFEGTVIETVLTNRLDGSFSGPVNCLVTTNVYSHDHTKLLIPQGTRALGDVSRVETLGQKRLAVAFHRLIMPDGYSVSLDKLPGLNAPGETGLIDQVNHHYLQVFGVSLAIGAIAGLSQANTQYGVNASAADAYRQGVSSSLSQSSMNILDRYLNVLPTFTIREGHRIKVYLTGDLLLPAYDQHRVPSEL